MTRITFTIKGVDELRFEFDNEVEPEDTIDEEMVTAVLQGALSRMEQRAPHNHTPLAEVRAARPAADRIQSSGEKEPKLETVACPTCRAVVGEACITGAGRRYFPGWGHTARIMLVNPDRKLRRVTK